MKAREKEEAEEAGDVYDEGKHDIRRAQHFRPPLVYPDFHFRLPTND